MLFKLNRLKAQIADILEPEIASVVNVVWNMMREVWLLMSLGTILSFDGKSVSKKILHRIFQGD